jgi:hypothetical protein
MLSLFISIPSWLYRHNNPIFLQLMQTAQFQFNPSLILSLFVIFTIAMSETNISLDGLSLSDEGLTVNLGTDPNAIQILDHCLIGRVLTDKQIRFAYFKERLGHFWKLGKKVSILQSDNGRFLFQFNHRLDAAKVVDEGPWLFDNYNMVIERIAPGVVPASVDLNFLDIWIQVHHLPFGFIQPKVGQAVGRFLGELKEYDSRNSVHSTYMRLKVRINVTTPLQQGWKVRSSEGNFVPILFKYEKLGIFCFLCGMLGHTDKSCVKLFDMEVDDGTRGWGENLRPLVKRMGTAATNKYLQDPIPSHPHSAAGFTTGSGSGSPTGFSHAAPYTSSPSTAGNLDGRLIAVQKEISAIKSGILSAQKQALVKSGRNINVAGPSNTSITASASSPLLVGNKVQNRPVVLGLLAETPNQPQCDTPLCQEADDNDDLGTDLKKRKRAKAAGVIQEAENVSVGVKGILGPSLGIGLDNVNSIHDNPMYDESDVMAGPEVQACRGL